LRKGARAEENEASQENHPSSDRNEVDRNEVVDNSGEIPAIARAEIDVRQRLADRKG
jgi:hypothetical protein